MHADLAAYDVDPLAVDDVAGLRPILTVSRDARSGSPDAPPDGFCHSFAGATLTPRRRVRSVRVASPPRR